MVFNKENSDKKYFDKLLVRIKEIRTSEMRVYQKITEIYKECSCDYESKSSITRSFYATTQNKFHLAITGKTAAELILERADSNKENMGLTNWKNSPNGNIQQRDVINAKNYYNNEEISELRDIVNMYLDYAERQAKLHNKMYMQNWKEKLDDFLKFNEYEILENPSKAMRPSVNEFAINEFKRYKNIASK